MVPITVAVRAELRAMIMLFQKLRHSSRSIKSRWYHLREKPAHLMLVESLKEENTRIKRGRKRKTKVIIKTTLEKETDFLIARFA